MSSDKSVPPTIQPKVSAPRPDTSSGVSSSTTTRTGDAGHPPVPPPPPAPTNGASTAAPVNGTTSAPSNGTIGTDTAGDGKVASAKAGAMKAAAAALAAARSAAKKVSTSAPQGNGSEPAAGAGAAGDDEIDDRTVPRAPRPATSGTPSTGTSSMRYSGAGLTGTATMPAVEATGTDTAGAPAPAPQPAAAPQPTASSSSGGVRRVRLAVSRLDPWSVMKLSFLLAVAIGIMTVVAAAVVWYVLDSMAVFVKIEELIGEIVGPTWNADILQYVQFDRVVSLATIIAVVNVVLITALSTIMAFLYNITASLVGGVHLTLTDD